jgi:hypothetical protein
MFIYPGIKSNFIWKWSRIQNKKGKYTMGKEIRSLSWRQGKDTRPDRQTAKELG